MGFSPHSLAEAIMDAVDAKVHAMLDMTTAVRFDTDPYAGEPQWCSEKSYFLEGGGAWAGPLTGGRTTDRAEMQRWLEYSLWRARNQLRRRAPAARVHPQFHMPNALLKEFDPAGTASLWDDQGTREAQPWVNEFGPGPKAPDYVPPVGVTICMNQLNRDGDGV